MKTDGVTITSSTMAVPTAMNSFFSPSMRVATAVIITFPLLLSTFSSVKPVQNTVVLREREWGFESSSLGEPKITDMLIKEESNRQSGIDAYNSPIGGGDVVANEDAMLTPAVLQVKLDSLEKVMSVKLEAVELKIGTLQTTTNEIKSDLKAKTQSRTSWIVQIIGWAVLILVTVGSKFINPHP